MLLSLMDRKRITLSIESRHDHIPLISSAVNKLCALSAFSESDAHAIELCVTEAVTNSINHAYKGESGHEVVVTISIYDTKLIIEVIDTGKSMAPVLLEERKAFALDFDPKDIEAVPESGRGLAIIQGIMDDVSYQVKENGNFLTMIIKIHHK